MHVNTIAVNAMLSQVVPGTNATAVLPRAECYAPANIALCKYWGKRNEDFKLPMTGSLSISLGEHGTRADLQAAEADGLWINGENIPPENKAYQRMFGFIDLFRDPMEKLELRTINTIPMAAGLASSASAFASVTMAMNELFAWGLDLQKQSILARIGSGSACRSLFDGFVEWQRGTQEDGLDSFAIPVAPSWPDFRVGIVTVSEAQKPIGSTEAMRRTVETAELYQSWAKQVDSDLPAIRNAVLQRDFTRLGERAEQNAMAMHATMIASRPPVIYWLPESVAVLHQVHTLRNEGVEVYATMDAGPNVKLLYLAANACKLRAVFENLEEINPAIA